MVKFFLANPDLVYADSWPIPRFATHSFLLSLEVCFKAYYQIDIEYTYFGKPQLATSNYAEKLLKAKATVQGIELSNIYMIGDNPKSDIKGANMKGWVSILVKTGVFKGPENDAENPATHIVEDL